MLPGATLAYHWTAETLIGQPDGAEISSWVDLVTGQAATQDTPAKRPTYQTAITTSGKPCVYFQGCRPASQNYETQYFVLPDTVTITEANTTVVWIGELGFAYPNSSYPCPFMFGNNAGYANNWVVFFPGPPANAGLNSQPAFSQGGSFNTIAGCPLTAAGPSCLIFDTTVAGCNAYSEGLTGTYNKRLSPNITYTGGMLGRWLDQGAGSGTDQAVYEILVYSSALTAAQRAQIERYAQLKYGCPNGTRRHNVICIGDSITAGVGANTMQEWPIKLGNTNSLWHTAAIRNLGVSGQRLSSVVANQTVIGPGAFFPAFHQNVAVVWLGTNDVAAGASDVTVIGQMKSLGFYLKSLGYVVVYVTLLPRGTFDSAQNKSRAGINGYLNGSNGSVISDGAADTVVDTTADGDLEDGYLGRYAIDGAHPNNAGYDRIAALIYKALQPLLT